MSKRQTSKVSHGATGRDARPVAARPAIAAVLLAAVFLLKLVVMLQLRTQPLLQPDAGLDTTAYADLARRVVGGDVTLGPGLYYVSPLYIYFLASVLAVVDSFTAVRVLQAVLGTISVWFVFLIARAWFGERAAWFAGGLAALTGLLTFYESLILQTAVDPFLTSAALLCLTLALTRSHDRTRWFLLSGAVFGVHILNRPNVALGAAAVALMLVVTRRMRPAAVLTAGLVIGMAPVMVRNLIVSNQWSLSSSHGGLNFYIGNSSTATGFFQPVPDITPNITGQAKDAQHVAERALGRPVSDAETSRYFYALAWHWIREHPEDAARLFARKIGYVFSAQHIALPHSYPFYAYDAGTLLRVLAVGPWLLIPLGLVGLALFGPPESRNGYLIWLAFVPGYAIGVATFFVAERYRLPLLVPLAVGAGAAVDGLLRAAAARQHRTLAISGTLLAGLLVLVNLRTNVHDGRWEEGLRLAEHLVATGKYTEAAAWVQRLESNAPRPGIAHYRVGAQLLAANHGPRALDHLTRAHRLDPDQPLIEYVLGQALLDAGRPNEAIPHLRRGAEAGIALPAGGFDLAAALHAAGDLPQAEQAIRRVRLSDRDDPELWLRAGRLASQVKAPDAAEPFFRKAVEMRPEQASARLQLGLNLLVLGRCDEAARELAEAVRLEPGDADALAHLAYCELELRRPDDARKHALAALAVDERHALANQVAAALNPRGPATRR